MEAVGVWLDNEKTPGRKVGQIDNRGSNFFLALYWAQVVIHIICLFNIKTAPYKGITFIIK